jgi:hypothetical protein
MSSTSTAGTNPATAAEAAGEQVSGTQGNHGEETADDGNFPGHAFHNQIIQLIFCKRSL